MAINVRPSIVTSGLVLNLDAANMKSYPRSGTTWRDLSGNNNSGSLVNGPTFSSQNGGSIVFDGVDDYIIMSGNAYLRNLLSTDCTVSVFCSYATLAGLTFPTLIGSMTYASAWRGWRIVINAADRSITFCNASGINGTNQDCINFNYTLPDNINTFSMISFTWVASTRLKETYVNGIKTNSLIASYGFQANTEDVRIASLSNGQADNNYRGTVALTQIYNRALSAQEILQNYNATKTRFGLQ